jgi:hypothetical protein
LLAAPTAGAVTGLIAYGVGKTMNGTNGLQSWQWLFIVEGVPTIAWGIIMLIFTPSMPDTVAEKGSIFFRTEEEKEIIRQRTIAGEYRGYTGISTGVCLRAHRTKRN